MFGISGEFGANNLTSILKIRLEDISFFKKYSIIRYYTIELEKRYFSVTGKQLNILVEYIKQRPVKLLKKNLLIDIDLDFVKKVPKEFAKFLNLPYFRRFNENAYHLTRSAWIKQLEDDLRIQFNLREFENNSYNYVNINTEIKLKLKIMLEDVLFDVFYDDDDDDT